MFFEKGESVKYSYTGSKDIITIKSIITTEVTGKVASMKMIKPKSRHPIRLKLGIAFYRLKRHVLWLSGGIKFAKRCETELSYEHFVHETPLLRHLIGIDPILERNKVTNLHITATKVHMVTLYPSEAFSFWWLIGKPTARKGYLEGVVLQKGAFDSEIGGGLCHLSGFIYWMTLHTPLTVKERHRHGYDTTPNKLFGSDATCFYNYKDLMIENNTDEVFQLHIEVGENQLKGAWKSDALPKYRYEIYEKQSEIKQEDWGGYTRHNHLHRRIYDLKDIQIGDEFVAENHAIMMYPPDGDL